MWLSPTYLPYAGRRFILDASDLGPGWCPPLEMERAGITFRSGEEVRNWENELTGWRWWSRRGDVLFVAND